jgi:glycoside/pentoside/hexuronide:cation symporter, GPH family
VDTRNHSHCGAKNPIPVSSSQRKIEGSTISTVNFRDRLLYSSGIVSYALKDAAFGAFILFYYKQVLGLSGTLTGLAIAISVVWDALSDPLVGAWSDKLRTRWGRRHPLMIASVLPMALGFVAIFSPPEFAVQDQSNLFLWLLTSVILLRTALTFFMIPYLALGAEITTDYHERTRLASMRTNLGWFSGVALAAGALYLLFTGDADSDGRFVVANYQHYGWLSAIGVVLFSTVCIFGTWHYIPALVKSAVPERGAMLRNILTTFRNRNFRFLVILETALGGMGGIIGALLMVTFTYFWGFDTRQISLLFGGPPLLAVIFAMASSRFLNARLEKQQLLQLSCALGALNLLWLTPLKIFGWLPDDSGWVFGLVFVNYALWVTMSILRTVANHALLADVADEHELESGQRQEGVMFAAAFFAAKFITGFGYLVAGPFLDLIGLEAGATPGESPPSVILGLGIIMGPALAAFMLIPLWMSLKLRVSLAGQLAVREALTERARRQ